MRWRELRDRASGLKLRTKILITLLALSLLPLTILASMHRLATLRVLTETSYKSLSAASLHGAGIVDAFLASNLDFVGTEAALPVVGRFARTSPNGRRDPLLSRDINDVLHSFALKDKVFIRSVGLLDIQGTNLADTMPENVGRNEGAQSYFLGALTTNLPFVSLMDLEKDAHLLCFSSPVQAQRAPIGVLRTCYNARVLQQIVISLTGLVGQDSFGILVDDRAVILAYGAARGEAADQMLFRSVQDPGVPSGLAALQGLPSTINPTLVSDRFILGGKTDDAGAVARLSNKPWIMTFVQSESVFLRPIRFFETGTILVALVVAAITGAIGVAAARVITAPTLRLTDVALRVAQGDLAARSAIQGSEETRILARTFNTMLDQIHERQEDLTRALRTREEFMSIAAHELRTPITPLKLQLDLLLTLLEKQTTLAESPAYHHLLQLLRNSVAEVNRLGRLIEDLLDISRIAAGRLSLNPEDVELIGLVRSVVERYQGPLRNAGCPISVSAEGTEKLTGRWDRHRIEQVIVNLLTNAMKYGAGAPVEVTISPSPVANQARLSVRDHGIGIEEKDQEIIFEAFRRAVSVRQFGGFGLGLYITRKIVEAHGGTIRVRSSPGKGATFIVDLPSHSRG